MGRGGEGGGKGKAGKGEGKGREGREVRSPPFHVGIGPPEWLIRHWGKDGQ